MPLKLPPPPQLPGEFGQFGQQLNRWLLEIQSILNSSGLINPSNVDGLPALFTQVSTLVGQVATLSGQVATLTTAVAGNTSDITTLTAAVAANTVAITALTTTVAAQATAITALQARSQIRNGSGVPGAGLGANGDLYLNNTGGAGTRLYGKIGGAWVAIA